MTRRTGAPELVFAGCYTAEGGGSGDGVAVLRRDPATGRLTALGTAARTPSPSFLARHPVLPVLYAVNETSDGTVSAFAVAADGGLDPLAVRPVGGSAPCHLAVTADARHLLVAGYGDGTVTVHPLDGAGVPGERTGVLRLSGSGPDRGRQAGPHAHMVAPDPAGPGVLVCDLGSDRVWRTRVDPAGRPAPAVPAVTAAPGTGPRHLLRTGDGALLVAGELSGDLSWYRPGPDGAWRRGGAAPTGDAPRRQPSELVTGRDGRFVYVADRGPDTVAVFAWDGAAATRVAVVPCGGVWPRHLLAAGDHLYVAAERSHTVTTLRVDPVSGVPAPAGEPVAQPSPTCLLRWSRA